MTTADDEKINATLAAIAGRVIEHVPEHHQDQLRASLRDGDYGFRVQDEWMVVVVGGRDLVAVPGRLLGLED